MYVGFLGRGEYFGGLGAYFAVYFGAGEYFSGVWAGLGVVVMKIGSGV